MNIIPAVIAIVFYVPLAVIMELVRDCGVGVCSRSCRGKRCGY